MNLKNTTAWEDRVLEDAVTAAEKSGTYSRVDVEDALERLDNLISELGEEKTGLQQENSDLAEQLKVANSELKEARERIDELEAHIM